MNTAQKFCLVVFVILLSAGCGEKMVTVKGTVSVNGKPVTNGKIVFHPVNGERSGSGPIKSDGTYVISYLKVGDGLPPGEYKVSIVSDKNEGAKALEEEPKTDSPEEDGFMPVQETSRGLKYDPTNVHIIPKEYNRHETTPLKETIYDKDSERVIDFDILQDE